MAHKLISSMSKNDRILSYGLSTGNFYNRVQVQSSRSKPGQILFQSRVYFAHKPSKTFNNPVRPNGGKNGCGTQAERRETIEKKTITQKKSNNSASTSPPRSEPKAPNEDSKLGGVCAEGDGKKICFSLSIYPGSVLDKKYVNEIIFLVGFMMYWIIVAVDKWWETRNYEVITWKEFLDTYLTQGRVADIKAITKKFLQVQTAPGASTDVAKTVLVKIDSLDSYRNLAPVAETSKSEPKDEAPAAAVPKKKVEPERDLTAGNQKLYLWLRTRFFYYARRK